MAKMIRMLRIDPLEKPVLIEVEHSLKKLQELVGGTLQAVYPWPEDYVAVLTDDEGKFKGYPANRILEDEDGEPYDILVGPFFICGLSMEDFASLPDDLAEKYTEKFKYPEFFMRTENDHVMMFRIGSGEPPRIIV